MPFPSQDLSLQFISNSYQAVLQTYTIGTSSYFLDGLGNVVASLPSASIGKQILTIDQPILYAELAGTSSEALYAELAGTSSEAIHSIYADTASLADSSSYAISASYATSASYEIITELFATFADSASWASSSISSSYAATASRAETIPYNGTRTIKRSPYTNLNVGGATLTDFIENFFFPFVSASVAISSGGTTYYETGSTQTISITSTITANDETLFGSSSVLRNSVIWNTTGSLTPLSFTFTDTNVTTNSSYVTYVQTDNDGAPTVINSNTKAASFIYPYLYGMSTMAGLSGNALYTEFVRQITPQGNKTVNLVGNVVYVYFCFPSSYGSLSSILDPNSFEIIGSFEYSSSVSVTSSGLATDWTTTYKVYRSQLVFDPNGNYQFKQ